MKGFSAKFLHLFLILAFVLAGISPACKFVSGEKSFMEICFSDGSLKRVEVPAEYNLAMAKQDQKPEKQEHGKKDDCAFCFTQTHMAKSGITTVVMADAPPPQSFKIGAGSFIIFTSEARAFDSRGPPAYS